MARTIEMLRGALGTEARIQRTGSPAIDACDELDFYWRRVGGGLQVPFREDVDPRDLGHLLPTTFLVERIAPGIARFCLAGHMLTALVGTELRSMPLCALFGPDARPRLASLVEDLFAAPARVRLDLTYDRAGFPGSGAAHALLLPLRDAEGDVTRAIGCLAMGRRAAARPLRLTLKGGASSPLPRTDDAAAPRLRIVSAR